MKTSGKLAALALTAFLLVGGTGASFAQSTSGGGTTATTANRDTDRDFDWGWLGLLGLIGLAGLMRRDRAREQQHGIGGTTASR